MAAHSVTLNLPESLYERFVQRAKWTRRSLETELLEAVAASAPVEEELSPDVLATVESLAAASDEELLRTARESLPLEASQALEALHRKQRDSGLSPAEDQERARLLQQYERFILVRAQAAKLLKDRGHDVSDLLIPR